MEASQTHAHLGRDRKYAELEQFSSSDDYDGQSDSRTVKDLLYTYHVVSPSPMIPGEEVIVEKTARRGESIPLEELGTYYLARGEQLGSFFTDDELEAMQQQGIDPTAPAGTVPEAIQPAEGEGGGGNFAELGTHEMAEYLEQNQPNVDETLALVEGDPEAAKRLLEAENIVTDNDPRAGVERGVQRIISGS